MTDSDKLDLLLAKMVQMDGKVNDLDEKADKLGEEVTEIRLTLENEIRMNIQRVGEGHLDLSGSLHEALTLDSEKEMLTLRVNML